MSITRRGKFFHYNFGFQGRQYRGSTKQTDKKRAEKFETLKIAAVMRGESLFENKGKKLLRDLWDEFEKWDKSSDTVEASKVYYRNGWALMKSLPISGHRIDRITELECVFKCGSEWQTNQARKTLRRVLHWAKKKKYISAVPEIKLLPVSGRDELIEPWMEDKLLENAVEPLRTVLMLMMDSGMRNAEVFRLKWEDVHFERSGIWIPKEKRGKGRWVALSSRCAEALKARAAAWKGHAEELTGWRVVNHRFYCKEARAAGIQTAGIKPCQHESNWVFPAKRSKSGHLETVQKQWAAAKASARIPASVVLYCARHTYGTDALAGTGNIAAVMKSMGHSQTSTHMGYQHPDLQVIRETIDKRNQREAVQ